jgi:DNA-directed RNA polymerase specialized sigma24 family protein
MYLGCGVTFRFGVRFVELVTTPSLDVQRCETLVDQSLAGDPTAIERLVEYLWPIWLEMVRTNRNMSALRRSEDDVRNVATRLVEKIARRGGRNLELFVAWRARHPDKDFGDWLRIVTANVVRDYVREHRGPSRSSGNDVSVKRLLNEFSLRATPDNVESVDSPFTPLQTARELCEFAERRLPADQLGALTLWLQGATFGDIGERLGVSEDEGRRRLRAAVAMLRRHFTAERD